MLASEAGSASTDVQEVSSQPDFRVTFARGVSIHRDALIGKGVIWAPRRGRLDFTVPLFAEYLRENHPLTTFGES